MSTTAVATARPTWMREADELPRVAEPSENSLGYVYSPRTSSRTALRR